MGLYDEWAYTQEVTITNNTTTDLTGFQEAIDLDDTWQGWDNVNADGSDIRFSTQDGGTAIPYWIELWDFANKTARIWVRIPSIPASGSITILMHWGKADAVSESNGEAVFEFFDDFEYDNGTWTLVGANSKRSYEIGGFTKVGESPDVDCHQGVAASPDHYYTFHTNRIDKRSKSDWSVVLQNTNPFGTVSGVDHIGDGDYYTGKLYVPVEHWASETDWGNLHIFIYNADTLEIEQTIDISANGHEGSSITVVPEDNALYITEYKSSGGKIYKYSLSDFSFLGSITPSEDIPHMQGITHKNGLFYIASENGKLYVVKKDGTVVTSYALVSDSINNEGVDFDTDGKLLWLQDDGTNQKIYMFEQSSLLHLPMLGSNAAGLDEGVYASVAIGENTVIETKMKIHKEEYNGKWYGATGIYFSKNDPPSSAGYYLAFGATDNGKFGITDWYFDDNGVIEYDEFPPNYDTWHVWTIKKNGNTYTLYYDGEEKGSITRTTQPKDYLVFGVPYLNNELWVDWVRVRKYAEQEPTVTLGALTSKWLTGWSHRNKITIPNNTTTDLTDFQVAIELDDTWDGWGLVKSDGSDIRVTDAGGSTLLPHWIEEFDATNKTARIWVRVPSIPANGSVDVYLYYGNPNATDASDGSAVFEFFDDFDGSSLDTSKWESARWTGSGAYSASVKEGYVEIYSASDTAAGVVSKQSFQFPFIEEFKWKFIQGTEGWAVITQTAGGSDSDWVRHGYVITKTEYYYQKRTSGTITTYTHFGRSAPSNWVVGKIIWEANNSAYYEDGALVHSGTQDRYSSGSNYLEFLTWNGGKINIDWVFVRKYAEQEPTVTIAAREDLQTVYTFYKRVKLILNDDASNEDVELIIDDKFKAFWANRGVELAIVKDGDDTRLLHTINSETTDHISITAHGVTGAKGDVYWLYFDDGQERDTSNLDDTFTPAGLSKTFSIDYILPGEPYVIYDVTFSGFAGKLAESDLTNLTVVDGNTNTVVAHKVVSYEKEGSGAVTSLRLQVRAAYATDTRTFYLYLVGKGQTFDTPDTYIYPVASTGWALLWEKKSVGVSTSILLDGNSFNVTEYDVGYRRNTYHFDIEEGESYNLPSSNYSRVFRLRLVATDDELSTLHTIMKRPYILVDWLGEEFYGQIIELRYRKNARRPMVYDVELTVERVRVV